MTNLDDLPERSPFPGWRGKFIRSAGMKVEGLPYFNCDPGDVMIAAQGRWHRAGDDPAAPWSTRVPFNPRPPILHNFEVTGD